MNAEVSPKITQELLATTMILLFIDILLRFAGPLPARAGEETPAVVRARVFELVNEKGEMRAQIYLGEDGGGNIRLRAPDGTIRVKMGGTDEGSGLVLMDKFSDPAVWAAADGSGTRLKLIERGKSEKIFLP